MPPHVAPSVPMLPASRLRAGPTPADHWVCPVIPTDVVHGGIISVEPSVAAGRPGQTKIDADGEQGLQQAEILCHLHSGVMVHHRAAGANAHVFRQTGDPGDQYFRAAACQCRRAMKFSQPIAVETQAVTMAGQARVSAMAWTPSPPALMDDWSSTLSVSSSMGASWNYSVFFESKRF